MAEDEAMDTKLSLVAKPIKWVIPNEIRTDHATHLIVQQQGSEFTLLFFEVRNPIFSGTPQEQVAAMEQLENVEATCVSRIVMSVEDAPLAASHFEQAVSNAIKQFMKGQEHATD
ncbi:MAG: hypothetical protein ABI406_20675 [Ktedonobacteraceae bacterium]